MLRAPPLRTAHTALRGRSMTLGFTEERILVSGSAPSWPALGITPSICIIPPGNIMEMMRVESALGKNHLKKIGKLRSDL